MKKSRMEIRVPGAIKDIIKECAEKKGMTISSFIMEITTDSILESPNLLSSLDQKILLAKKRDGERKKLRYLQKQHRSIAFEPGRMIQIIQNYEKQKSFIDYENLKTDIELYIEMQKNSDTAIHGLRAIIPQLMSMNMHDLVDIVKLNLIELGVPKSELEKPFFSKDSISLAMTKGKRLKNKLK
jgi:hypothetical protein